MYLTIPEPKEKQFFSFGTAGFRAKDNLLHNIAHKLSSFIVVLSQKYYLQNKHQKSYGIMISASHNAIDDNGFKISTPEGNFLYDIQQKIAQEYCNGYITIQQLRKKFNLPGQATKLQNLKVILGGDSRPSTQLLKGILAQSLRFLGSQICDLGLCTTPQLFYCVLKINEIPKLKNPLEYYVNQLIQMYQEGIKILAKADKTGKSIELAVDCANGVGAWPLSELQHKIKFPSKLFNTQDWRNLNNMCGSQYVQKEKKMPMMMPQKPKQSAEDYSFFSFDGDADRIVAFVRNKFILEGDRLSVLFSMFLNSLLQEIQQFLQSKLKLKVIQTMYSNIGSTNYIKAKGIQSVFAATGVKYLHKQAQLADIGVYFEANGHGSIVFSKRFKDNIQKLQQSHPDNLPIQMLNVVYRITNPTVGDSVTNLMVCDLALKWLNFTLNDLWNIYVDQFALTSKIKVNNKSAVKVTAIEDRIVEPIQLQHQIDRIIKEKGILKAFVRPSGTEDVLRLHVEGKQAAVYEATKLISEVLSSSKLLN